MAKSTVPVNFKDDIINSAMGGKRRYRVINNSDGTISLEDVTNYDQVGSTFGAAQMNATNAAVNAAADAGKIIDDIDAIRNVTQAGYIAGALALKQVDNSLTNENNESFNFGVKDGVRGFFTNPSRADDSFIPFKGNVTCEQNGNIGANKTQDYCYIDESKTQFIFAEFVGYGTNDSAILLRFDSDTKNLTTIGGSSVTASLSGNKITFNSSIQSSYARPIWIIY